MTKNRRIRTRIFLAGHVAIDSIIDRPGEEPRTALGGPIGYCSTALKSYGAPFDIYTKVGKDFPKEFAEFLSSNAGITLDPFVSETFPTTRFRIDRSKEPRQMWLTSRCEEFDSNLTSELNLGGSSEERHLLMANPIAGEISTELLSKMATNFETVLADSQGFIRSFDPIDGRVTAKYGVDLSCLEDVDYLKGDRFELSAWSGAKDLDSSMAQIGRRARHVILTSGSGPVDLYEGTSLRFRAKPLGVEVRDTTGAGDIMLAIFAASLAEGEDERDSLRRAVAAATIAVEKVGIRKAILDRKQVEDDSKKIDVLDY